MKTLKLKLTVPLVFLFFVITPVTVSLASETNQSAVLKESQPSVCGVILAAVYLDIIGRQNDPVSKFGLYSIEPCGEQPYLEKILIVPGTRIEFGTNNLVMKKYVIIDKITQKPAKRFWARIDSLSARGAKVKVGWYNGSRGSQSLDYDLRLKHGKWAITNRVTRSIS